jgi:spore maturation protein CgeB
MKILLIKNVDPSFDVYADILNSLGHEALLLQQNSTLAVIQNSIESFRPDFVLINNADLFSIHLRADGFEIEQYFNRQSVPVVVWEYEAPYFAGGADLCCRWREGRYLKNFLFFNIDSYWVEEYRKAGIHTKFLPFGVDPRLEHFKPSEQLAQKFSDELVYIGTAFVGKDQAPQIGAHESDLRDFFINNLRDDLVNRFHLIEGGKAENVQAWVQFDEKVGPEIDQIFFHDLDDVYLFNQEVDRVEKIVRENLPSFVRQASILEIAFRARLLIVFSYYQMAARLKKLIPLGLRIYGEGAWQSILPEYPLPVSRLSYPEMYAAFRSSKIVFCYTKKLFINNVHERVPHILGAGGFPIIDFRGDLQTMYGPNEVASYRNFDEATQLIRFYTKNESARQDVISKGRDRTFRQHTYTHRLQSLIEMTGEHYGISTRPHRQVYPLASAPAWANQISHPSKVGTE